MCEATQPRNCGQLRASWFPVCSRDSAVGILSMFKRWPIHLPSSWRAAMAQSAACWDFTESKSYVQTWQGSKGTYNSRAVACSNPNKRRLNEIHRNSGSSCLQTSRAWLAASARYCWHVMCNTLPSLRNKAYVQRSGWSVAFPSFGKHQAPALMLQKTLLGGYGAWPMAPKLCSATRD